MPDRSTGHDGATGAPGGVGRGVGRGRHRREGPRVVPARAEGAKGGLHDEQPGREPTDYGSGQVDPVVLGPDPTPSRADLAAATR